MMHLTPEYMFSFVADDARKLNNRRRMAKRPMTMANAKKPYSMDSSLCDIQHPERTQINS